MERKQGQQTTQQGHEAYYRIIEGNLPEAYEVEMKPNVEVSLPRQIVDKVMQRLPRRDGKR